MPIFYRSIPDGYETLVGKGVRLSGGQANDSHRSCIAQEQNIDP